MLLFADDLTGAGDSALGFVKRGITASVLLEKEEHGAELTTALLALVTHTRALDAAQARQRMEAIACLHTFDGRVLFHKVDSAGRGNPGVEMAVLAEVSGCDAIVYAPAYPSAGRVVRNGRLCVNDFCGQSTEIDLAELIPLTHHAQVRNLPRGTVESLRQRIAAENFGERKIWICDAESEGDLDNLVSAASSLPLRILWSGSAGLAAAVADQMAADAKLNKPVRELPRSEGSTLVISGTDHPVTLAQIGALSGRAVAFSIDELESIPEFEIGLAILDWKRACAETIRDFWKRLHLSDRAPVSALVLTGGDTAAFVLEALGASVLEIGGEVEEGIPWSIVRGGAASGAVAITKSGGFGSKASLNRIADFCQRMKR